MNDNCWLKDRCNQCDCDKFCMRYYKLNYLYNAANLSINQRSYVALRIDNNNNDLEAFKRLKNIEENIETFIAQGDNLYIHSQICGNGKTSWALRLIQSYFNKIWFKTNLECKALFINVPRFLLELKNNITEKSEYVTHIKDNVLQADLVVWDEIGSKGLTQFEHENILNLINARIDAGKSNIYTSNLNNEELHNSVGDRLYSRICNYSYDIEFHGSDKRGIK